MEDKTIVDLYWQRSEQAYCEVYYLRSGYLAFQDTLLYDPQTTQEWEYTAADGTPLLLDFYRESVREMDWWDQAPEWFILRDINGDGTEDLLLSMDGDRIDMAYTYRRGKLISLDGGFWLCQGDVVHFINESDSYMDGTVRYHGFRTLRGSSPVFQDALRHFVSQGSWRDKNDTKISEAQAQAVLAKYPHAALNMRPIKELTG